MLSCRFTSSFRGICFGAIASVLAFSNPTSVPSSAVELDADHFFRALPRSAGDDYDAVVVFVDSGSGSIAAVTAADKLTTWLPTGRAAPVIVGVYNVTAQGSALPAGVHAHGHDMPFAVLFGASGADSVVCPPLLSDAHHHHHHGHHHGHEQGHTCSGHHHGHGNDDTHHHDHGGDQSHGDASPDAVLLRLARCLLRHTTFPAEVGRYLAAGAANSPAMQRLRDTEPAPEGEDQTWQGRSSAGTCSEGKTRKAGAAGPGDAAGSCSASVKQPVSQSALGTQPRAGARASASAGSSRATQFTASDAPHASEAEAVEADELAAQWAGRDVLPALRRGLDVISEQMRRLRASQAALEARLAAIAADRDAAVAERDAAAARGEAAEAARHAALAQRDAALQEVVRLERQVDALVTVLSVTLGDEPAADSSQELNSPEHAAGIAPSDRDRRGMAEHDEALLDAAVAELLSTTKNAPADHAAENADAMFVGIAADGEADMR